MISSRRITALFTALLLILTYPAGFAYADNSAKGDSDYPTSGVCNTCSWEIDSNGILTIHEGVLSYNTYNYWASGLDVGSPWEGNPNIKEVKVDGSVTANNLEDMFQNCTGLEKADLRGFDTSVAGSVRCMFMGCTGLTSVDLSSFNTANMKHMEYMFYGCSSLKKLDLSTFDTKKVTWNAYMFNNCTSLQSLKLGTWDLSEISDKDDPDSAASFPVDMREKNGGPIFSAGDCIPEGIGMHFVRANAGNKITEDMLYGEYYSFLKNQSYINMTATLYDDMFAGMANRSGWMDWLSEARYAAREAPVGAFWNMIVREAYGTNEKDDQKKLALEMIYDLADEKELSSFIPMQQIKTWNSANKAYGKLLSKSKPSAKEIETIAKAFSPDSKKKQKQITKCIKYFSANGDEFKKISDAFKEAGRIVTVADVVISAYVLMETDSALTDQLYDLVDKDSFLAKGLEQIKADQDKGLTIVFVRDFMKKILQKDVIGTIGNDLIIEKILIGIRGEAAEGAWGAAEIIWWGISYIPIGNTDTSDDTIKAWRSLYNARTLQTACRSYRTEIANNWKNGGSLTVAEMKSKYSLLMEAYKVSLICGADKVADCAPSAERKKLEKDLVKYKNKLGYNSYIKSCLKNANTAYTVVPSTRSRATGVMITEADAGYGDYADADYIDIPSEVEGQPVVGISEGAFSGRTDVAVMSMPDSLTTIGDSSFSDCSSLDSVYLGNSVRTIGTNAFSGCSIDLVDVPDTVDAIGEQAFGSDVTIRCAAGLTAAQYAADNGLTTETRARTPVSIEVSKDPDKTTYRTDELFDKTGVELKATYADGSYETITDGFTSWNNEFYPGENTVYLMYADCSAEYTVTVTDEECEYTVYYVDPYGIELAEPTTGTAAGGSVIYVDAWEHRIDDYIPDPEYQSLAIGMNNRLTFTYYPEPKVDISEAQIVIQESAAYTGKQIRPAVRVDLNGTILEQGSDYNLYYGANIDEAGYVVIEGINQYEGVETADFNINKQSSGSSAEAQKKSTTASTAVGTKHVVGGSIYQIKSGGKAILVKAKNKRTVTLPATVSISGKTFKISGIAANAFQKTKCKTLNIKTKLLTKKSVRKSLKGSKIKTIKIKVGKKTINKKFTKKYKKFFTKKNAGKKVSVK